MRTITILLLISTFISPLFGQKKAEISSNKIKSLIVTQQKTEKGKAITQKDSETYYDTHGNIIEEKEYKDGKIVMHMTYQYDKDNNKTKETELNSSGKVIKVIENKFQGENKIKETELNSEGKVTKVSEYKYQGNFRTEKIVYDGNGKLKSKKIYTYEKY